MSSAVLLAAGSAISIAWGVAHLVPTRSVVAGFGSISSDNRRIVTMEWVAEGVTLIFVGALPLLVWMLAPASDPVVRVVARASAAMLLVMAAWTAMTGSRTAILPMKLCPLVKTAAASVMLLASLV